MAWDTELVLMVRILINDMATPQSNTDAYIQQVLVAAGVLVDVDIELAEDYTFDVTNSTISPDPVTEGDSIAKALLPLKAACILQTGNFAQAIGQGIRVRDGDSMIDTSVSFRGYRDILEMGPCASYEKLRWQIQATGASGAQAVGVVLSPYRAPDVVGQDSVSWFFDDFATALGDACRRCRR